MLLLWRLGVRFARARHQTRFISFVSLVSILGIALGQLVLITVLSIMNGFQYELKERILNFLAHATVRADSGYITDWQETARRLSLQKGITAVAPLIDENGLLFAQGRVAAVYVSGILPDEERHVSTVADSITDGTLDALRPGGFGIVIGDALAIRLGVDVGDQLDLIVPRAGFSLSGVAPRMRRLSVVGIFAAGMAEYDNAFAYMHLADMQRLYGYDDTVSGLRLHVDNMFAVRQYTQNALTAINDPTLYAIDWTEQNAGLFGALQMEKRMMFIVVMLIIAVAAFNITSSMIMSVNEKRRAIAILRTLGLTRGHIVSVFVIQGLIIGVIGTFVGVASGILVASHIDVIVPVLEELFRVQFFPADVYYISEVPSRIAMSDVVSTAIFGFGLAVAATLYPAWYAGRLPPARCLHHE